MKEQSVKKFLEFNGKTIYFLSIEGTFWIAIKPICEALKIDYSRQLRTLKADLILGGVWSVQTMHDASGRLQQMTALPEFYIYGWIFSIRSESIEFNNYKWECYKALYNYFHGSIIGRLEILKEKTFDEIEIEKLERELEQDPKFLRFKELKEKVSKLKKSLTRLDNEFAARQLELWQSN